MKVAFFDTKPYDRQSFDQVNEALIQDDVLARLLTFPNVLVTSHQGFFTTEALNNIAQTTLTNLKMFFENGDLTHEICYRCQTSCPKDKAHGEPCFEVKNKQS